VFHHAEPLAGGGNVKREIIAEIGQNHNGDMKLAVEMIRVVKKAGADVAKFQLYDARRLFPKKGNPWFAYNCRTELSRDNVGRLADACRKEKIEFMASVFDVERLAWLEELGVKRHKIASRSIQDKVLLGAICATDKPLLVSLGMWQGRGFPRLRSKAPVEFLYCVSKYPVQLSDMKLGAVDFGRYAGLSDHTIGISASIAALSRGARIIEKHFTLNKKMYGPDHSCSMTPAELSALSSFRDDLVKVM
jgi:sialic acid synthase SpsE